MILYSCFAPWMRYRGRVGSSRRLNPVSHYEEIKGFSRQLYLGCNALIRVRVGLLRILSIDPLKCSMSIIDVLTNKACMRSLYTIFGFFCFELACSLMF